MKRKLSILLVLVMIVTSVFGFNSIYAFAGHDKEYDIEFSLSLKHDGKIIEEVNLSSEQLEQAKTNEGLDIIVPYGFITKYGVELSYEGNHNSDIEYEAVVPEGNNIVFDFVNDHYDKTLGCYKYSEEAYIDRYKVAKPVTHEIFATIDGSEQVIYKFNYIEDKTQKGDSVTVTKLAFKYTDVNGEICETENYAQNVPMSELTDGITVSLPCTCDTYSHLKVIVETEEKIFTYDSYYTFTLEPDRTSGSIRLISVNGKTEVVIPVKFQIDYSKAETGLQEVYVSVYKDSNSGTEIETKYYVDLSKLNHNNEVQIMLPREVDVYKYRVEVTAIAKGDAYFPYNIDDPNNIKREASRTKIIGTLNVNETRCATFNVYSPTYDNVYESYDIVIGTSNCNGKHNMSNWTSYGYGFTRVCINSNCPYEEEAPIVPPTIQVSNDAETGGIKLSWSPVTLAKSYEIYRSVGDEYNYSLYYTTSYNYFNNMSVEPGKTYYYKVKTIFVDGNESSWTKIERVADLPKPTNVKVNNVASSGKPKVTWSKVDGASEYKVYRATSKNGTYTYMYTTKNTNYTNTSAVAGKTYYYKVEAVCAASKYGNSALSDPCYVTCDLPQPKNVKVTTVSTSGKPKITWSAVDGASKYYIYRADYSNGTYKYMYSTTNTNYTNTSATPGNTYYYKVVAVCDSSEYGNSAKSSYGYVTCDLAKPNIKITLSDNKPKISWSAVNGADRYEVYRKVGENGTYSKYYTTVYTNFTNSSAAKGITYYYKVVAVCDKTKYANSAYSNEVKVTSK